MSFKNAFDGKRLCPHFARGEKGCMVHFLLSGGRVFDQEQVPGSGFAEEGLLTQSLKWGMGVGGLAKFRRRRAGLFAWPKIRLPYVRRARLVSKLWVEFDCCGRGIRPCPLF